MLHTYRSRSILGLLLMISQAFLYNAVFFTYALILTRFYDVPAGRTGLYLLPFDLGNFEAPLVLGRPPHPSEFRVAIVRRLDLEHAGANTVSGGARRPRRLPPVRRPDYRL